MRCLALIFMFFLALSVPVRAAEIMDTSALESALPPSAGEIMEGFGVESISAEALLERVWSYMEKHIKDELSAVLRPVGAVAAAAMLCSVGESVQIKKEIDYVNLTGCLVIAAAALGDVNSVAAMGREALSEMHEFSRVLLPMLTSAAAAAGALGSSAAKYAASALFMDILMSAAKNLVLPLLGAYTAALVASAAMGDGRLKGAVKLMKWLSTKALKILAGLFGFCLSLTGLASAGADAAAVKTARAVLSSFVPVVGKMMAGASESLAAGMGLIRGAVGLFGLGAVLSLCAAPFLAIGLRCLLFKAAAAVVGLVAGERIGSLVDGIGSVYGMVLALVATGALFMFISVMSLVRTVV